MKSYLAKLADRALRTNAIIPSHAPAGKVSDPFERAAAPENPMTPADGSAAPGVMRENGMTAPGPRSSFMRHPEPLPRSDARDMSKPESDARAGLIAPKEEPTVQSARLVRETRDQEADVDQAIRQDPVQLAPSIRQTDSSRTGSSTKFATSEFSETQSVVGPGSEGAKGPEGGTSTSEKRLAQLEDDHLLLLRKADEFMLRLRDRPQRESVAPIDDAGHESKRENAINRSPEEVHHLQPSGPAERIPDREPPGPSLVIGSLTVEVTPQPQSSSGSRRRVVVVRESRRGDNDTHSSRRFGLSQF